MKRSVDVRKFQMRIIGKSVGLQRFVFTINFNDSYCQTKTVVTISWRSLVYLPVAALALMSFGMADNDGAAKSLTVPHGWIVAGTAPTNYRMGIDPSVKKDGKNVATIQAIEANQSGTGKFGTLSQVCLPGEYAGKRVRMTADIKSEILVGWAGMWFRVDGKGSRNFLAFDNMKNRPIKGTTDWEKYEIVLDVPSDARMVAYGVLLDGDGKVWLSNISFEIVDDSVPVTSNMDLLAAPLNLDFSK